MVQTNEPSARAPIQFGENMRITVAANQGGRRYMEDRCVVHTERSDDGILQWTFVGVYDGHGGEHASEYVRRHLLMNITKNAKFASDNDEDILESIRQGFLMTHEQMRHVYEEWPYTASGFPSTAGTTVSCVFIRNGKLYTGHVGDSAIYLGTVENGELHSQALTIDHKPESAHEQLRIAKAGGETAVKSGVTRVVWKRESRMNQLMKNKPNPPVMDSIPFLSVARSLGDLWSFNEATNMFVVSPEPDLGVHPLTGNDFCLVLASDGMTNVLTGEQAISIVFKEEELVEINEEINRNHSRCVLKQALQRWRSLRSDNITVATVIFDIDPLSYTENEMLMKVGRFANVSQVLSDRPDGMLKISKTDNVLLSTQRTPILYTGSRDDNYCRVLYRGPGFRTHEEEVQEERKNMMSKYSEVSTIAIASGSADSKRGPPIQEEGKKTKKTNENREDDGIFGDDDDEDEDGEGAAEEINLSLRFTEKSITVVKSPARPSRPHAPRPVFQDDDSIIDENEEEEATSSTAAASTVTPLRSPGNTVRRVKAEAIRRLRTPKIGDISLMPMLTSSGDLATSPDRRVTRSASRAAIISPIISPIKNGGPIIGLATHLTSDARLPPSIILHSQHTPRRRSSRLQCSSSDDPLTPGSPSKLNLSRKRPRMNMEMAMSGVTPVVAGLSLQDRLPLPPARLPLIPPPVLPTHSPIIMPTIPPTPSRSAPTSPKRELIALKTSKWSLSKLEETKKKMMEDGIIRVSEIADEDDDDDVINGSDDVMREPPSKIRRFVGYFKRMFWGNK